MIGPATVLVSLPFTSQRFTTLGDAQGMYGVDGDVGSVADMWTGMWEVLLFWIGIKEVLLMFGQGCGEILGSDLIRR